MQRFFFNHIYMHTHILYTSKKLSKYLLRNKWMEGKGTIKLLFLKTVLQPLKAACSSCKAHEILQYRFTNNASKSITQHAKQQASNHITET